MPSGIAVDYLSDAAKRYGFKIKLVSDEGDFASAVEDVRTSRQRFDLLLTFSRTPEREKQFAVTVDYLTAPWVVYARRDSPYIIGLESLNGKTIAAEKGYLIGNKIKADYPAIRILEVPNPADALHAVATGQADAYVGNLANASYLAKAYRLDNLVVTAPTRYGINTQAMAIRNDWPELAGVINKGIAAMTLEKRNAISHKWGGVEFKPRVDYTLAWQIVVVSSIVLLALVYWNRKLAREIVLRKETEKTLLKTQRVVEESEAVFRLLIERAPEAIILYNPDLGRIVSANQVAERLFGCSQEILLQGGPERFYTPRQPDGRSIAISRADNDRRAMAGEEVTFERTLFDGVGGERICEVRLVILPYRDKRLFRASYVDITERKKAEEEIREKKLLLRKEIAERKEAERISLKAQRVALIALADLAENRDTDTGDHVLRVASMTHEIARTLLNKGVEPGVCDENFLQHLGQACILHDVGKVTIPDSIMFKPGKLSIEERRIMETHAFAGGTILNKAARMLPDSVGFKLARDIAHYHHENWDGSGYPDGLQGREIPLSARIVSVADVFDALIYRARSQSEVLGC